MDNIEISATVNNRLDDIVNTYDKRADTFDSIDFGRNKRKHNKKILINDYWER